MEKRRIAKGLNTSRRMTRKDKWFAKHLFEAALSDKATVKTSVLGHLVDEASKDVNKLWELCNITGNVKDIEWTWDALDQRVGDLISLAKFLRGGISVAIEMAAGGRTRQIVSKTRQPERAAK